MGEGDHALRGALGPLSGLICEIVNSVGQGNFTFVRKRSGNFRNLWLRQTRFRPQSGLKNVLDPWRRRFRFLL